MSNVHKLNCFFRIWKTDAFWCRDPTNKFVSLPLSVQARLRNIARQGARFIEHDILRELDEILAQQGATKPDERLAIWASLWQLILIYRETLAAFKKHMGRVAKESDEFDPIGKRHHSYLCSNSSHICSCRARQNVSLDGRHGLSSDDHLLPLPVPHQEEPRSFS